MGQLEIAVAKQRRKATVDYSGKANIIEAPMHHHYLAPWEWISIGAAGKFLFIDVVIATMPPYFGNNYWVKWLYAALHAAAANWDKLHIPGSPADRASNNPSEKH
jgi:hypothetical protein